MLGENVLVARHEREIEGADVDEDRGEEKEDDHPELPVSVRTPPVRLGRVEVFFVRGSVGLVGVSGFVHLSSVCRDLRVPLVCSAQVCQLLFPGYPMKKEIGIKLPNLPT